MDESRGYLGFITVTLPPPPQRFPFGHDNLKNILVTPFKFGMWVYMGNDTNAIVLDLQFQGHWWPLKGQILAIFSHFGPVLIEGHPDRQSTSPRPFLSFLELFSHLVLTILHGNY